MSLFFFLSLAARPAIREICVSALLGRAAVKLTFGAVCFGEEEGEEGLLIIIMDIDRWVGRWLVGWLALLCAVRMGWLLL